jgi:hypothetical protein
VARFDPSKPSIARVYDYLLDGKDNFAADREVADQLLALAPVLRPAVRENRALLTRAVRWAGEQGISQFVDLGCGMPTEPSTQQSATAVVPDARVAYVDNDAIVISHLNALCHKDPAVVVADRDLNNPRAVLGDVAGLIDLSRPVCLLMGALLHFYEPPAARDLVAGYAAALAPGSYVVLTVITATDDPEGHRLAEIYSSGPQKVRITSEKEFASYFGDLEIVPPGVGDARTWRPGWEGAPAPEPRAIWIYGGIARKTALA